MKPEEDDDIERLLDALRNRGDGQDVAIEDVWAFAAGELPPERAERVGAAIGANRAAMEELGAASFVLDAGRSSVDVERVMAKIARDREATARARRWWLRGGFAAALAAAAVLVVVRRPSTDAPWDWAAIDVVPRSTRGDPNEIAGIEYRVRLVPSARRYALLLGIASSGTRPDELLHPPTDVVRATPDYANWPGEPFAPSVALELPPPPIAPFELKTTDGFVLLITRQNAKFDEATIEQIREHVRRVLGALPRVGAADVERVAGELRAEGYRVDWRPVRAP